MNNKKWLLISVLFLSVFLASNPNVYSGDPDELNSLRGLRGVFVLVESLPTEIEGKGLTRDQIKTDVELKLRLSGIKVASNEKERFSIPGWPYLYVNVNPLTTKFGLVAVSFNIHLVQEVNLKRTPDLEISAITWSKGSVVTVGEANLGEIRTGVKDLVDVFINDYLSVNPKGGK